MKQESEKFADILMEGIRLSENPRYDTTTYNLAVMLHEKREHVKALQDMIEEMNQTVIEAGGIYVKCRSCQQKYELPCDLSEFNPSMSYCGGSERCIP